MQCFFPSLIFRIAVIAVALTIFIPALTALDTREPAPGFTAMTLDGEKLTNSLLKGKVVLLQFWTTWCPYCRRDEDAVEAITKEFAKQDLLVVAVNVGESRRKVKQYLQQSPRSCKVVITEDTNLAAIFAAKSFPMYVLIDRQGKIAGTQNGAGGEDMLRRLLSKAEIEPQQ